MTQLNLLPNVKLEYIKARQRKRLIIGLSTIVSAFFMLIFVILLVYVRFSQPKYMDALTKDIKTTTQELKGKKDLDKILTIQNQLNSLPELHDKKAITSRMFDYLVQTTPAQATISDVDADFEANTINIKGNADALSTVNKFTDTLKFTDYKSGGDDPKEGKAFSNVVLKSFTVNPEAAKTGQGPITYEIELSFDPTIFTNIKNTEGSQAEAVKLNVPKIITTRSETEKPADLFVPQPESTLGEQ